MPMYEYICADCDHAFEELILADEKPLCPECESPNAEKQFSTFAAIGSPKPELGPGPCGTCGDPQGPGACSI
jgi:putative FmdB family regulatory protein